MLAGNAWLFSTGHLEYLFVVHGGNKPTIVEPMRTTLPLRAKKIIGTFFIIILVVIYALVAVAIASATLADAPWYAHLAYFAFTGFLWVVPAMVIIKWMSTDSAA